MSEELKRLPDLDLSVYVNLASSFRDTGNAIWGQNAARLQQVKNALLHWGGETAKAYIARFEIGYQDGAELVGALFTSATLVDGNTTAVPAEFAESFSKLASGSTIKETNLLAAAQRENQRRLAARIWLDKKDQYAKDHPEQWYDPRDWFNSRNWEELIGPMPAKVPEPFLEAPTAPQQGGGGGHTPSAV